MHEWCPYGRYSSRRSLLLQLLYSIVHYTPRMVETHVQGVWFDYFILFFNPLSLYLVPGRASNELTIMNHCSPF